MSNFLADVSSKIIALADPVLSQPDMEREMVSSRTGAYIPSFTIYHVLPDLPGNLAGGGERPLFEPVKLSKYIDYVKLNSSSGRSGKIRFRLVASTYQ